MYKIPSPGSEAWCLIPKDFAIPLSPNILGGSKNHFCEEGQTKLISSRRSHGVG
mgnify:FL=1